MPRPGRQIAIDYAKKAVGNRDKPFHVVNVNEKDYRVPCTYCGMSGHKEENCYVKKNGETRAENEDKKNLARQEFFEFKAVVKTGRFCVFCHGEHHYSKCTDLHTIADPSEKARMFCASSIAHGIVTSAIHGYFTGRNICVYPHMFCDFSKAVSFVDNSEVFADFAFAYRQFVILMDFEVPTCEGCPNQLRVDNRRNTFVKRVKDCIKYDVFDQFERCNVTIRGVTLQNNNSRVMDWVAQ